MSGQIIYEIVRFGVGADEAVFQQGVQIDDTDDVYICRVSDGSEFPAPDVALTIAITSTFHEVRASEITRIKAVPEVVDQLPYRFSHLATEMISTRPWGPRP